MEWLPFAFIAVTIILLSLHVGVKWAVKDDLKEYFKDKINKYKKSCYIGY